MAPRRGLSRLRQVAILEARRRELGWTFPELADRAGFAENTVMRCLHGENVHVLTFLTIAEALSIDVAVTPKTT